MSFQPISERPNPPGASLECPAYARSRLPNRLAPWCGSPTCPAHGEPPRRPAPGRLGDDVSRYHQRVAATQRLRALAGGRRLAAPATGRPLAFADGPAPVAVEVE